MSEELGEMVPGKETRFVEVARLLRQIMEVAEADGNVLAAYLAPFGNDEGFGVGNDAWASLNVHLVLRDEALPALATGRGEYIRRVGGDDPVDRYPAKRAAAGLLPDGDLRRTRRTMRSGLVLAPSDRGGDSGERREKEVGLHTGKQIPGCYTPTLGESDTGGDAVSCPTSMRFTARFG